MPNRPSLDEIFSAPTAAAAGRPSLDDIFAESAVPVDRGVTDAALRQGVKGLTLGFDDELGGGLGAAVDKLKGDSGSLTELYTKHRDDLRKKAEEARAAHPYVSTAANVIGSIPTLAATGGTSVLGAGLTGAAMGLGNSDADLTKGQYGHAAIDTAVGGALGAGTQKVLGALAPSSLKEKANELAARAMKGSAGQYAELGEEGVQNLGRWALDNKAVNFGSNAHDILANVQGIKSTAGEAMGQALQDEGIAFGGKELADQARQSILPGLIENNLSNKPANAASQVIENLSDTGIISLPQLQSLKSNLGKEAYNPLGGVEKEGLVPVERFLNKHVEDAVDASSNVGKDFLQSKNNFKMAARGEQLAEKGAARGFSSQGFSLGDKAATGIGMGVFGGVKGLAVGAANKLTRERGAAAAAVGMDKISNLLQTIPDAFGPYASQLSAAALKGPQALAVSHYLLSQKDPQYQQLMEQISQ